MLKRDELRDPQSCLNRAGEDEMTFVLLGRDVAASAAIRAWISERIRLGKNRPDDPQIAEAAAAADAMSANREAETANQDIFDLVIADLRERDRIGWAQHNRPLRPHDGRNSLRDAYEEALDQAVYLRKALAEWESLADHKLHLRTETASIELSRDQADAFFDGKVLTIELSPAASKEIRDKLSEKIG